MMSLAPTRRPAGRFRGLLHIFENNLHVFKFDKFTVKKGSVNISIKYNSSGIHRVGTILLRVTTSALYHMMTSHGDKFSVHSRNKISNLEINNTDVVCRPLYVCTSK